MHKNTLHSGVPVPGTAKACEDATDERLRDEEEDEGETDDR